MTHWLDEEQQQHWRAWIAANSLLTDAFSRDLQESHGLTLADYEILVRLSESGSPGADESGRRMRMSELAEATLSSRSRLSHQIDRMERAGYVERVPCTDDKRGFFAALTPKGWDTLVAAAPSHVDSVRARIVDVLTPEEFIALGTASQKLLDKLSSEPA
jgi:DNA-binding MarR family transcriptional regulator